MSPTSSFKIGSIKAPSIFGSAFPPNFSSKACLLSILSISTVPDVDFMGFNRTNVWLAVA